MTSDISASLATLISLSLNKQPVLHLSYSAAEAVSHKIIRLRGVLCEVLSCLRNLSSLYDEFYVLEKLVYKGTGPFRQFKHFHWLKRLRRYAKRLEALAPVKRTESFVACISALSNGGSECPSQQCLNHLLANLWLVRRILAQISCGSVECAKLTLQQLELKLFIPSNTVVLSVNARIYNTANNLLAKLSALLETVSSWLSSEYSLKSTAGGGYSQQSEQILCKDLFCARSSDPVVDEAWHLMEVYDSQQQISNQNDHLSFLRKLLNIDIGVVLPTTSTPSRFLTGAEVKVTVSRPLTSSTPIAKMVSSQRISRGHSQGNTTVPWCSPVSVFNSSDLGERISRRSFASNQNKVGTIINDAVLCDVKMKLEAVKSLKDVGQFIEVLKQWKKESKSKATKQKLKKCFYFLKRKHLDLKKLKSYSGSRAELKKAFKALKSEAFSQLTNC